MILFLNDNANIGKILTKTMKKDKKVTTIKGRIVELIENQGENISTFLPSIGLSYSNFKGKQLESSPSADILVKIKSKFPMANIDWVLTGKGEMLMNISSDIVIEKIEIVKEKDARIEDLRKQLSEKDAYIKHLLGLLDKIDKAPDMSSAVNVIGSADAHTPPLRQIQKRL